MFKVTPKLLSIIGESRKDNRYNFDDNEEDVLIADIPDESEYDNSLADLDDEPTKWSDEDLASTIDIVNKHIDKKEPKKLNRMVHNMSSKTNTVNGVESGLINPVISAKLKAIKAEKDPVVQFMRNGKMVTGKVAKDKNGELYIMAKSNQMPIIKVAVERKGKTIYYYPLLIKVGLVKNNNS